MSEAPTPEEGQTTLGRPSDYTEEMGNLICILISEGKSLRWITEQDGTPHQATVYRWLIANPDFREKYRAAREAQQDTFVDETIHIADTEPDPQRARVRIWARQWHASKLRPKVYGDRIDVNPDPETPMNVSQSTVTAKDRAKAMAALLARKKAEEGDG